MISNNDDLDDKERALHAILGGCGSAVIGYSGGVDSVYLAKAALDSLEADRVLAVVGRSQSYPAAQYQTAMSIARSIGLPHLEIETHELEDSGYVANPADRCYFCKTELYGRLVDVARERGYAAVLDGSNADDLSDYRPGLAAARELGVRSPLQEAGLTKAEIRTLSRRAGLPTWEMPASPCLASRIPYGLEVTAERLRRIEAAESRLRTLHRWADLRVRHEPGLARLEIPLEDLVRLVDPGFRERVVRALEGAGFSRSCLDLQGYRRGALNESLASRTAEGEMNRNGGRATEAERRLAETGILARVESVGVRGAVAAIKPSDGGQFARLVGELRGAAVEQCRAAGFRCVALELD